MKINQALQIAATLVLGISQGSGVVQVYRYSGPVAGWTEAALTPGPGSTGEFVANFGNVTEFLFYDPVAQTLRQVGFVTVSPSRGSFDIVPAPPPNDPPPPVGSATLSVGFNGIVPFDYTSRASGGVFSGTLLVPVTGVGVYEGRRFAGSWVLKIQLDTQIDTVTATSLTFSQQSYGSGSAKEVIFTRMGDLTDGGDDGSYDYSWGLTSVVATALHESHSGSEGDSPND